VISRKEHGSIGSERKGATAQAGDPLRCIEEETGREVAKRYDDPRRDQGQLLVQKRPTGRDLVGQRIPVARRTAFHDIGDVDLIPAQTGLLQKQPVEELPRSTDEGTALQVLFPPRPLAYHHEVGVGIPLTEDDRGPAGGEGAAGAGEGNPFYVGEPRHGDPSYRAACVPPPISVGGC
jgi:hypothetical protein